MTKYLFLCNTSGTKPVLIFKGFRLDAHTEPMIPVMQYNIKSCKNQQRSTSILPVVTLVTPDHGGAVILLAAGGADPDLVAGLVQVAPHSLGDDAGGLVTGVRLHNLLGLNLDLGLLYTGRSLDWSLS